MSKNPTPRAPFIKPPTSIPVELACRDGAVRMVLPAGIHDITMTPEQSEKLGHALLELSVKASGRIIIPGGTGF